MTDSHSESSDSASESSDSSSESSDYIPENSDSAPENTACFPENTAFTPENTAFAPENTASAPAKIDSGKKRKICRTKYTDEQLSEAVMKVKTQEMRLTKAAFLYKIPVKTLSDSIIKSMEGEYYIIQYNTVKPKTFKPNLLDEPKDISSREFFFSLSLLF